MSNPSSNESSDEEAPRDGLESIQRILEQLPPAWREKLLLSLKPEERSSLKAKNGQSKYNAEALRECLDDEPKNMSAIVPQLEIAYSELKEAVKRSFENSINYIAPLSKSTVLKWHEVLLELFKQYPSSQEILTTPSYLEADVDGKAVRWRGWKFHGEEILKAATVIENTIMTCLTSKRVIYCLPNHHEANVLDVWKEVIKLKERAHTSVFDDYLSDLVQFWQRIVGNHYGEACLEYATRMSRKYSKPLIQFMESLGYGTVMSWKYFRTTALNQAWLEVLNEMYQLYEKDPRPENLPSSGVLGFWKTLELNEKYSKAFESNGQQAIRQTVERQKRNAAWDSRNSEYDSRKRQSRRR